MKISIKANISDFASSINLKWVRPAYMHKHNVKRASFSRAKSLWKIRGINKNIKSAPVSPAEEYYDEENYGAYAQLLDLGQRGQNITFGDYKRKEEEVLIKSLERPSATRSFIAMICTISMLGVLIFIHYFSQIPGLKITLASCVPVAFTVYEDLKAKKGFFSFSFTLLSKIIFILFMVSLAIFHIADYYYILNPMVLVGGITGATLMIYVNKAFINLFPFLLPRVNEEDFLPTALDSMDLTNQQPRDVVRFSLITDFLFQSVVVPALEEVFYRGIITLSLYTNQPALYAVFTSATTYALLKGGSKIKLLCSFFNGLVLCSLLCCFHGNLAPSFIAHSFYIAFLWSTTTYFMWKKVF